MPYDSLPSMDVINKTIAAVNARGIAAELAADKAQALERVKALIPPGSEVMTGASVSLGEIGFDALAASPDNPWNYLKAKIMAEKDRAVAFQLRKQSTLSDYYLGSVHALAETGQMLIASATGSQIPAYIYTANHVIWVVGAQKITPTLEDGFKRLKEYIFPREDERMKKMMGPESGSLIGKILIFEKESPMMRRKLNLILVNEVVGC